MALKRDWIDVSKYIDQRKPTGYQEPASRDGVDNGQENNKKRNDMMRFSLAHTIR